MNLKVSLLAVLYIVASPGPCLADESGARGIFFEQLKKPQERINTGVSYWVEVDREGTRSRVSNKVSFVENDKVRFHFTANFDGFAYILMIDGSKGEKTVLFPAAEAPDNRVAAGQEIVLPYAKGKEAWLRFDDNPGTEVVRIVVSRDPINPKEQLDAAKPTKADVVVSAGGAKADSVPAGTLVSLGAPAAATGGAVISTTGGDGTHSLSGANDKKNGVGGTSGANGGSRALSLDVSVPTNQAAAGEVTVVRKDASRQLAIDISLEHKKRQ